MCCVLLRFVHLSSLLASQADELAPVGNYAQRKQDEETRLQDVLERLNSLSLQLSPPGPSTAAGSVPGVLTAGTHMGHASV